MVLFLLSLLKFSSLPSLCLATIFIPGPLCLQRVLTTQSVDTKSPTDESSATAFDSLRVIPSLANKVTFTTTFLEPQTYGSSQSASSGRIAHLTCTNIYMFANQIRLLRLPPFSLNETLAWFQRTKTHVHGRKQS